MSITVTLKDICDFYHSSFGVCGLFTFGGWRWAWDSAPAPGDLWHTDKEGPDSSNPRQWWKETSPRASPEPGSISLLLQLPVITIPSYLHPHHKSCCIRAQRALTIPAKGLSKGDISFSAGSHIPPVAGGSWAQPNTALPALGPTPR